MQKRIFTEPFILFTQHFTFFHCEFFFFYPAFYHFQLSNFSFITMHSYFLLSKRTYLPGSLLLSLIIIFSFSGSSMFILIILYFSIHFINSYIFIHSYLFVLLILLVGADHWWTWRWWRRWWRLELWRWWW